ncbi:MAG: hypothetical protein K6T83_05990 [Alicyclobacillus sp.]|nr:hypothetical protein [Alicyclobacillus sp.]
MVALHRILAVLGLLVGFRIGDRFGEASMYHASNFDWNACLPWWFGGLAFFVVMLSFASVFRQFQIIEERMKVD